MRYIIGSNMGGDTTVTKGFKRFTRSDHHFSMDTGAYSVYGMCCHTGPPSVDAGMAFIDWVKSMLTLLRSE